MTDVASQSWEYLETLPGTEFFRLYRSPSSALAIFRKRLSSLAKIFVMALLYMKKPLAASDLDLYVKPTSQKEKQNAIEQLRRYHIFSESTTSSGRSYQLTRDFRRSLKCALTGAGDGRSFGEVADIPVNRRIAIDELDDFARQQWEGILGYMVGSPTVHIDDAKPTKDPSPAVIELLKGGHLIEVSGTSSRAGATKITKEGFAFVLQDVNTQVWTLLFQYVEASEYLEMEKVAVLSFLFLVSSLELGLAYSKAHLDETQLRMLQDLTDFGIVYQPDGGRADHFYPTRLATALTSDSTTALASTNTALGSSLSPSSTGQSSGFIVIETNFRVYAYTSSPLQIALLNLFIKLRSRHPNLVIGKMTKMSVQHAVQSGITAEQIIAYLTSHAHPQMRRHAAAEQRQAEARNAADGKVVPVLPATILDQIHLWQLERDRMTATPGFLLKEFANEKEYLDVCKYADEIGVLVWKSDKKRCFFVSRIEGVRAFLQERKERAGSG